MTGLQTDPATRRPPAGGTTGTPEPAPDHSPETLAREVNEKGMVVVRGAFAPEWADALDEDLAPEFSLALRTPGRRRPARVEPVLLRAVRRAACGASGTSSSTRRSWRCPSTCSARTGRSSSSGATSRSPGAENQPWHRDFPMPRATREERRLTSIAVNASAVDVVDGPFQGILGHPRRRGRRLRGRDVPGRRAHRRARRATPGVLRQGAATSRSAPASCCTAAPRWGSTPACGRSRSSASSRPTTARSSTGSPTRPTRTRPRIRLSQEALDRVPARGAAAPQPRGRQRRRRPPCRRTTPSTRSRV